MPFNKLIGMQVTHYDFDKVELRIKMEQKLIGNPFHHNILHGGVTASLLDGGRSHDSRSLPISQHRRAGGLSPQLSPGKVAVFAVSAPSIRVFIGLSLEFLPSSRSRQRVHRHRPHHPAGSKVAVARMETAQNEEGPGPPSSSPSALFTGHPISSLRRLMVLLHFIAKQTATHERFGRVIS